MTALFTSLFGVVTGIVFPATVTPVSVIAAFGLLFPLIGLTLAFLKRLASSGS